jgi:hypothetical protein
MPEGDQRRHKTRHIDTRRWVVVRIDRSPMNKRRWCLELECGHEEWITSSRRPTREFTICCKCRAIDEEKARLAAEKGEGDEV